MKKSKEFTLKTITDLKVFLIYILDNIRYPVEETELIKIVEQNTRELSLEYPQCLAQLADSGHILFDEIDGIKYYMIADKGRETASELYDTLDKGFREKALKSVTRYLSLERIETEMHSHIEMTESKRYRVIMEANDKYGDLMRLSLTVNSMAEAEEIKSNFDNRPDGVYRGILFSATGRMDFLA